MQYNSVAHFMQTVELQATTVFFQ